MSGLKLAGRFQRANDIAVTEMDGELVMMSIEQGAYFGLSGVGVLLWELLEVPIDVAGLVDAVVNEFDVGSDQATDDVTVFMQELLDANLVKQVA